MVKRGAIVLQGLGLFALLTLWLAGCAETSTLSTATGIGRPNPQLPAPVTTLIPNGGTSVARFAEGLDHPRWIYLLPNWDVLVAETNAPPKPDDSKGIRGQIMNLVMKKAGAAPLRLSNPLGC